MYCMSYFSENCELVGKQTRMDEKLKKGQFV